MGQLGYIGSILVGQGSIGSILVGQQGTLVASLWASRGLKIKLLCARGL